MFINISYDSSVGGAPAGFVATVNSVASFLDNLFTSSVTVNINVGFGEVAGMSLPSGALGASYVLPGPSVSYAQLATALQAQNAPGSGTLPATAPTGRTLEMARAEEKALGLLGPSSSVDGSIGFDTSNFDYDRSDGITAGLYDFYGAVAHEITEVMGRVSGLDASGFYAPMDLYRYAQSGVRQLTTAGPAYFSVDSGVTNLNSWNTSPEGDLGDWALGTGNDSANAFGAPGVIEAFTSPDVTLMNALGWGDSRFHSVVGWDLSWRVIASGDFNHDGTSDVIWDNGNGVEGGWLMGNGTRAGSLQLPFFPGWTTVANGDFNGDGTTDIMWQNANGLVAEWIMGSGTRQGTAVIQDMAGWHVIATGDFNHDGIGDVIWDNGHGVEGGWLMNSNAQIAGSLQLPFFPDWNVVATGDFNGDGTTDIMWKNASGLVAEWFMGSGTRQGTQVLQTMAGSTVIATGDFNHDGITDVMWRDASGVTSAWLMNSNGQIAQTITYGNTGAWNAVASGDFNHDGFGDVMWENSITAAVTVWDFTTSGNVQSLSAPLSGVTSSVSTASLDPSLLIQQMASLGGPSSGDLGGSPSSDPAATTAQQSLLAPPHFG